jgi:hypothetical protein
MWVGNHDGNRIDALLLVEHLAVVLVARRLVPALEPFGAANRVDVCQRHDLLGLEATEHARCPAARPHAGDRQFFVRRLVAERLERGNTAETRPGNDAREQRPEEEMTPGDACSHAGLLGLEGAGMITPRPGHSLQP